MPKYIYGVRITPMGRQPLPFANREEKGLPSGTLEWHLDSESSGPAAQAASAELFKQRTPSEWLSKEPLTPVEEVPKRTYHYGIKRTPSGMLTFYASRKPPAEALSDFEYIGTYDDALELARALELPEGVSEPLKQRGGQRRYVAKAVMSDLVPGAVVLHTDGEGHHKAVLLRDLGNGLWAMLFYTTHPYWSAWYRLATTEERAFARVRSSKRTFLAYAERSVNELSLLGASFPQHRTEALLREVVLPEVIHLRSFGRAT